MSRCLYLACALACLTISSWAAEQHGQVTFGGLPLPGATITATQGEKKFITVSDAVGNYAFPDLADGVWKFEVEMTGFAKLEQEVTIKQETPAVEDKTVVPNTPAIKLEMKLLSLDAMIAQTKAVKATPAESITASAPTGTPTAPGKSDTAKPAETAETPKPPDDSQQSQQAQQSNDGFLVNGSVNNAATSQFTLTPAFGNSRRGTKSLYTGGFSVVLDNSALDAQPFSLSGLVTPRPVYNKVTAGVSVGGPLNIPHLMPRGPNFFVGYQWTRNRVATTDDGIVPTAAERSGDLPNGTVTSINPVAQALLNLYPLPNVAGSSLYNYQLPVLSNTHQDAFTTRLDKTIGQKNQVYGSFSFQSTRASGVNLFSFLDTNDTLGINSNINWVHRFNHSLFLNLGFRFSRLRSTVLPYFDGRVNVSGADGITGNDQDAADWGPPALNFTSISSLSDVNSAFTRNRTDALSPSMQWFHNRHNVTMGVDFRRQEYNYLSQQNPRGTFTFTGAASGISDFADFLEGLPDTSGIAYGNADKYFRQSVYDAYATDDWRIRPELTINAGMRWEYGAPMTELFGRLVNLDIAPGFSAVAPVLGSSPNGTLTGQQYPASLLRPDHLGIEPRVGISWRPIPGSSVVVRAGYGIYDDTSVYQSTALSMAQQSPLSKSLSVQRSAACPETLANGFNPCASITADTFAVDPNFRVGYAQGWQLAIQRDLPAALQMTATYFGVKGTRGVQTYLPNTYPAGAVNPCPSCPTGFVYRTSNGDSKRESGNIQLRRRLRSGFTATVQYTYSKSVDDDSLLGGQGPVAAGAASQSLGTAAVAQNWLNLSGERGLSTFDQRHLLNVQMQYTTGQGLGGGTLLGGWRGKLLKEWTAVGNLTAGSGLPETPIYLAAVNGTGVTGTLRPNRTSASIYAAPTGSFLNAAAYAAPQSGQWGNAGRDSITGPGQLSFNASLARTYRLDKRLNLDMRVDSTNILNHVVYTSWNTTLNPVANSSTNPTLTPALNPLFGLPAGTNAMRSMQITARLRF